MTGPVLKMVLAGSWRGGASAVRRSLLVAASAAVVSVVLGGCVSSWLLSVRVAERASARTLREASPGEAVAIERAALFDETPEGQQIYVYWWRVHDRSVRIPGVPANAPPGSWFVAPALAERLRASPALATRYPNARLIDKAAVAHPGELLAYRFVGPEVILTEQLAAAPSTDWIGDGGRPLDLYPLVLATVGLVAVPGLGLLVAATAPGAMLMERRWRLLYALGASRRTRAQAAVLHALVTAGPGSLLGAVAWYSLARELTTVPFVGRAVFAGDLAIGRPAMLLCAGGVAVMSATIALVRPHNPLGVRPSEMIPKTPSVSRVLPLALGLAVAVLGVAVPGRTGAKVFFAGVVASAVGAVLALPFGIDRLGRGLAMQAGLLPLLLGRRLRWGAVPATRSLLAVGAIAALAPLTAAWVAVARASDSYTRPPAYAVELRGEVGGVAQETIDDLAASVGAVPMGVVVRNEGGDPRLVGDCAALQRVARLETCDTDGRFRFMPEESHRIGGAERLDGTHDLPAEARKVATIFVSKDGANAEHTLRAFVVNGSNARLHVNAPGRVVFHESPLVDWILGGAAVAGIVGGLALALHVAGHAARFASSRARLVALGASLPFVRRVAAAEAALSVAAAGFGSAAVGVLSSWLFVQMDTHAGVPMTVIGVVLVAVALAAGVAGGAAALAVTPSAQPTRD